MAAEQCITVHRDFDHARIVLVGDLDIVESEALDDLAITLFSELTATVEVDMQGVTFFGSRALAALLHLRTEVARHSGAEMRISHFNGQVRRIFELTGVLEMLAMGPALAEPMISGRVALDA
jgi:anti-anti-sigma factor